MDCVAKILEAISRAMAQFGCGAASTLGGYQPKEPKNIFKK